MATTGGNGNDGQECPSYSGRRQAEIPATPGATGGLRARPRGDDETGGGRVPLALPVLPALLTSPIEWVFYLLLP